MVLLVGLVFMVAFRFRPRHERSPFSFLGAAPGMSVGELRDVVVNKRKGTVECHPEFDAYQNCAIRFKPDAGPLTAIVDPGQRVIVVHAADMRALDTLHAQADSDQQSWSRVAGGESVPPLVAIGDTGAVRWTSIDHRFTAEQHFASTDDRPTQVILVDTKGVEELAARSSAAAERAKQSGWVAPTAEEASKAAEEQRANRQSNYDAMVSTIRELPDFETAHWNQFRSYTDNVGALPGLAIVGGTHLEILTATDSGWTAKSSNPALPRLSCVAAGGRVPAADQPFTAAGRSVSSGGVTCDPLP